MRIVDINNVQLDVAKFRKTNVTFSDNIIKKTSAIIASVEKLGDRGLLKYTQEFEGVELKTLRVSEDEIRSAYKNVTSLQLRSINAMRKRLVRLESNLLDHLSSIKSRFDRIKVTRLLRPIESVGCYVPGGKARYPSTLLMCCTPANVAGVKRLVVITPPRKDGSIDPLTLVAADICKVQEVYKLGGAQGIAALAFGTESIRKVDKIVGPGGIFVTAAKNMVSHRVAIDMVAGPTELLVFADSKSHPRLVAIDLISQSEHSSDTLCGVVTTSRRMAMRVKEEINKLIRSKDGILRGDIISQSLNENGFVAICKRESDAIDFINEFAPEHLEIMTVNAGSVVKKIRSAGLILIGKYTPSAASDYCLGSNHVLPTLGFAKSRAGLSVMDFLKMISCIELNAKELKKIESCVREITTAEGLFNHYKAVEGRFLK
ncbi:MAG TPA: histidinol dehydrogenase [Nitrososphaeraceae archaeon]|nr:histidinol dehydrogenase [Nitrososphaeraceae archaeon]